METLPLLLLVTGLLAGGGAAWAYGRVQTRQAVDRARGEAAAEQATLTERLHNRDERIIALQQEQAALDARLFQQTAQITGLTATVTRLQSREEELLRSLEEQRQVYAQAEKTLIERFKALSSDALRSNNEAFLELAQSRLNAYQEAAKGDLEKRQLAVGELVKPMKESLERVEKQVREVEKARKEEYGSVTQLVQSMQQAHQHLQKETGNLVNALRTPGVRGRWGEIQLRRVVEMAGMVNYCDFEEQAGMNTEDGRLRPDMVIRLPNGRSMVVDSKAPMQAYLDSLEAADDASRRECLQRHARLVRTHLGQLGAKGYAANLSQAPDFVVLFLPGEMLFSAALEADPSLIEDSVQHNVVLATPTTLIALLRAVHYGWRQEQIAEEAQEISRLGRELYERTGIFAQKLGRVGGQLNGAVKAYNMAVGSFDKRFLVSARRFQELGAADAGQELPSVPQIDRIARELTMAEPLTENLPPHGDGSDTANLA